MNASLPPPLVKHGEPRPGVVCACGDHAFANLTRGFSTMVDAADIGVFNRKWSVLLHRRHASAVRIVWPEKRPQFLARLLAGAPAGKVVDHINGNALDNRRRNLRVCTQRENSWNSRPPFNKRSGLPLGVSRRREKFRATISLDGKYTCLGTFDTVEAAHAAYIAAATKHRGEFVPVRAFNGILDKAMEGV